MGNNLKKLRKAKGLTLPQAAKLMGMSYGGYVKLERSERRLASDHIARAAAAFDVPGAAVICDEPSEGAAEDHQLTIDRFLAAAQGILEGLDLSRDRAVELAQVWLESAHADLDGLEGEQLLNATRAIARHAASKASTRK